MKGYSLHIGVNKADSNHYPGLPDLRAAVNDAKWWKSYAKSLGYKTAALHDDEATTITVKGKLKEYASVMAPGDILLLTYSGHGGEIPNKKPDSVDKEKMDQTWCLYNEQMLDDELYECFQEFEEGIRILVVSDSCHSGTVTRDADIELTKLLEDGLSEAKAQRGQISRQVPDNVQAEIMGNSYDDIYKPKLEKFKNATKRKKVKAAVKLLAACQDQQVTYDGETYGIFTGALGKILGESGNTKTGQELISAIKKYYSYPRPNFFEYGAIIPSFDAAMPFAIEITDADKVKGYRKPELKPADTGTDEEDFFSGSFNKSTVVSVEVAGNGLRNFDPGAGIEVLQDDTSESGRRLLLEIKDMPYRNGWAAAHALHTKLKEKGIEAVVEPVLHFNPGQDKGLSRASSGNNDYIPEWPPANANPAVKIGWHLDDDHSQLDSAAKRVMANTEAHVRVGHIDTGYLPGHIGLPQNLAVSKARSFVNKEKPNQAIDTPDSGMDGHGMGTMGILAGNKVPLSATFNEFEGYIGGVPFAEVVPIRISNSVVIWNSENFTNAIEYALEQGCDVVTMSMAGKPSPRMAKVINKAYEEGLVIVSAASNCWYKGLMQAAPKCVIWPAAFERVIAATGALYDHKPYDREFLLKARLNFTEYMQGCWGPESRMKKALAAYTPNTPWASKGNIFARSGGGTSSATPQIAAAAALWIAHNRKDMEAAGFYNTGNKWKIVEAVRYALYNSAAKDEAFPDWKKYYGNGILRANKALDIKVADLGELKKSAKAESSFGGFFQILGSLFKNRRLFRDAQTTLPAEEALSLELLQLLQTDPAFFETFAALDLADTEAIEGLMNDAEFINKIIESPFASEYLKQAVIK